MADRRRTDSSSRRQAISAGIGRYTQPPAESFDFANSARPAWAFVFFAIFAVILFGRLVVLQIIAAPSLSEEAVSVRTAVINTTPRRGTIYDRNGNVLAVSVDCKTIYANPVEVTDPAGEAVLIASVLGGDPLEIQKLITQDGPLDTFVFLKRKAELYEAEKLQQYDLPGVHYLDDTKRRYPYGEVAGQIVGFCNIDGEGVSGLEYYYDDILKGSGGTYSYEQGLYGIPIAGSTLEGEVAVAGQDIIISIDIEFQRLVEQRCKEYAEQMNMPATSAIVMDAETGEIYAACSLPLFNPADTSEVAEGSTQLRGITTALEPGSVFKTVSAMALLESNSMTPDDKILCPTEIAADEYFVSDAHDREEQEMSLREIINRSSNVGISLSIEQKLGFVPFYNYILQYNLDELTGVDYPGESGGYLSDIDTWSKIQGYNVTFGQGVLVTPIQLVRFYGSFLNDGYETTPHFLIGYPQTGEIVEYDSEKVIQNTSAIPTIVSMLETVVEDGTAKSGQIDGFRPAGKTGTAEVADPEGGYIQNMYNLDFCGFLSQSSSSLVCYVGADNVGWEGSVVPLFKNIMLDAIERYRIVSKVES